MIRQRDLEINKILRKASYMRRKTAEIDSDLSVNATGDCRTCSQLSNQNCKGQALSSAVTNLGEPSSRE